MCEVTGGKCYSYMAQCITISLGFMQLHDYMGACGDALGSSGSIF